MGSEYVKISKSENYYGQKHLLYAQLETLDLLKRVQTFRHLRQQEFLLKIELKNKLTEAQNLLEKLEKLLPVSHYQEDQDLRKERRKEKEKKEKHSLSLQGEIEEIQKKIATLQQSSW